MRMIHGQRPQLEHQLRMAVKEAAYYRETDPGREISARAVLADYLLEQGLPDDSEWFDRDVADEVAGLWRKAGETGLARLMRRFCVFRDGEIGHPVIAQAYQVAPLMVRRGRVETARGRDPMPPRLVDSRPLFDAAVLLSPKEWAADVFRREPWRGVAGAGADPAALLDTARVTVWVYAEDGAPPPIVERVAKAALQIEAEWRGLL